MKSTFGLAMPWLGLALCYGVLVPNITLPCAREKVKACAEMWRAD